MVQSDDPIEKADEDRLGRIPLAQALSRSIQRVDASKGSVVGILGPWGSGKTSLINLIRHDLVDNRSLVVIDFNPWMFSGTDQLVGMFFREIAAQLNLKQGRFEEISKKINEYGRVLSPLRAIPVLGDFVRGAQEATAALENLAEAGKQSAVGMRDVLSEELATLDQPIVVIIDDIDRLHTSEIRDVFRLIRLTASFPNVIYLIAFDRQRVECALTEQGIVGRDYLEKIVQVVYDLPAIPEQNILDALTDAMDEALKDIQGIRGLDRERWTNILHKVIHPLFKHMRDVRRYAASIGVIAELTAGKVAVEDMLTMEAIRLLLPDLFSAIGRNVYALTRTSRNGSAVFYEAEDKELKAAIDQILEVAGKDREIAVELIRYVFPAALRHLENFHYGSDSEAEWLVDSRLAHREVLRFYLQGVAPDVVRGLWSAETAISALNNRKSFRAAFRLIPVAEQRSTFSALGLFHDKVELELIEPYISEILGLIHEIPDVRWGPVGLRPRETAKGLIFNQLKRIDDTEAVEEIVSNILGQSLGLSEQRLLLSVVKPPEHGGPLFISPSTSKRLNRELRSRIRAASAEQLAEDWDLLTLLAWVQRSSEEDEPRFEVPQDPGFARVLLRSAIAEESSQYLGSLFVEVSQTLRWNELIQVTGDASTLKEMIELVGVPSEGDEVLAHAIKLALEQIESHPTDPPAPQPPS